MDSDEGLVTPKPLTAIVRPWASAAHQIPHFYRLALGRAGPPKSLTFMDRTSISQVPRFYQPEQTHKPTAKRPATGTAAPYLSRFGKPYFPTLRSGSHNLTICPLLTIMWQIWSSLPRESP